VRNPGVHFEITGNDAKALASYRRSLFGWEINADTTMGESLVHTNAGGGIGIGAGDGGASLVTFDGGWTTCTSTWTGRSNGRECRGAGHRHSRYGHHVAGPEGREIGISANEMAAA